jgi:hypothetical protein
MIIKVEKVDVSHDYKPTMFDFLAARKRPRGRTQFQGRQCGRRDHLPAAETDDQVELLVD